MPDNQQELNLKNEMMRQSEARHEEEEHEWEEHELASQEQEAEENEIRRPSTASERPTMWSRRTSNASQQPQGYTPEQARWMEGLQAYQQYQATQGYNARQKEIREKSKRELEKREKERKSAAEKREEKRRRRDQQYNARIERGGPGAIWAALKKLVMQVIVDNVSDLARNTKEITAMAAGAAKDAIVDRIRRRSDEPQTEPNDQLAEQAKMLEFMERNGYLRQQSAQPQAEENQQERQSEQPQAVSRESKKTLGFAEQRDNLGRNLESLDNMCRSAALITGEPLSRRDLSIALACMHDPNISGMSEGQSRFESEKLMKFLAGERMDPQDGPINADLLKKGLTAARQPHPVEREGFLGAMHNLSRVISRAPSLDSPYRMAAGEALNEIAKECADSKNITRAVSFKDAKIAANLNENKTLRQIAEIRGALTCANLYRQGKQAQFDELDRVSQMQQRGINPEAHRLSPDHAKAIAIGESVNRNLAQHMTQERIKLNQQQEVSRRADDIARMPMPNPMTMEASDMIGQLGKTPGLLEKAWEQGMGRLKTSVEMLNVPASQILDELESNRGALAERITDDILEIKAEQKRQREEEKRRERDQEIKNAKQSGKEMSA